WYFSDGNLHLTTIQAAEDRLSTRNYNIGELLDTDFDAEVLTEVMVHAVAPETWELAGGPAGVILLADVLLIRQSDQIQSEVAGLLAALKNPSRRTFTYDAPQHERLRQRLERAISINFRSLPLIDAVTELSKQAECDIR